MVFPVYTQRYGTWPFALAASVRAFNSLNSVVRNFSFSHLSLLITDVTSLEALAECASTQITKRPIFPT